jgi:hypothetical protein
VVIGLVALAGPPIWRGRLSGKRSRAATVANNTLEPREPGAGFTLATNWPGLALIALGAALASRHARDEVVRTLMRLAVTGRLAEDKRKYTLALSPELGQG